MMKKFLFAAFALLLPLVAEAQDDFLPMELQEFGTLSGILPVNGEKTDTVRSNNSRTREIIPFITSSIPEAASYNIANPEQVFCYVVTKRPQGYKGYTLGNYAITSFCGELNNDTKATAYEALFTRSPNIITAESSCRIEPRIMLRFLRGIDYTDVLLSSPCPSFTVFYAGRYKAFNIKQGIIDDLVKTFEKKTTPFHSPALIKKTVANAEATTTEEQEALEKKSRENAPVMNWKQTPAETPTATEKSDEPAPSTPKGWGNLNLKLKK